MTMRAAISMPFERVAFMVIDTAISFLDVLALCMGL